MKGRLVGGSVLLTLLILLAGCAGSQGYMAEDAADSADTGPSPPVRLITAPLIKAEQQRRAQRTDHNGGKLVERDPSPTTSAPATCWRSPSGTIPS
jgi:hypothetical protein